MTPINWIALPFVLGAILYGLFCAVTGICVLAKLFTWDLYHHWRYTTRGLCPGCKKPATVVSSPADQLYGPDSTRHLVCSCVAKTLAMGDRHSADWAGF